MTFRAMCLTTDETGELVRMLASANLLTEDVREQGKTFFRIEDDVGLIGFGGWEGRGQDRLLRSLVIAPERQRQGFGRIALQLIEEHARRGGAERLHLLTADAALCFKKQGYEITDRVRAPGSIQASAQFSSLCPGSATYMVKTFDE
jgi:amino-acid N-acetyltransferase